MLFIGHTRFSLFEPDSAAWHASKGTRFETVEEYQDYLFSDDRLAPRTEIFIKESLPQLEAAIGEHDVLHVVSYSDSLPNKYQRELENAADRYKFLVLDKRVNGKSSSSLTDVTLEAVERVRPERGVFGRYRLDDDDLLPATYFDQVAPYLTSDHVGWMVSLGTGYTGIRLGSGYYDLRRAYYPMLALGLLSICKVSLGGKIVGPVPAPHESSDRKNPVIMDSRGIGYFWGRHPQQDTALGQNAKTASEVVNRLRDSISGYPSITDQDDIKALFPAVWHKMHRSAGLSDETENLLPGPVDLDENLLRYSFEPILGNMGMSFTLECSNEPTKQNALVSFDLTAVDNGPIAEEINVELLRAGIVKSANESIGYYRYLPTFEGLRSTKYVFELPEGVACRGAGVRRFGKSTTRVRMRDLAIYAVPSDE